MSNINNTILYVDDEEFNLILFKESFHKHFNVITTISTIEAREILKTEHVKVLVTDLKMPEESGLEFIKNVMPDNPDLICIVLSAYSDVKTILEVVNQGVIFRYLLKPWDRNEIILDLTNACNTYDLRSENLILLNEVKHKNYILEKTAKELKEREQQFFEIFNSGNDAIMIVNKIGNILIANVAFFRILGISEKEPVKISDFLDKNQIKQFFKKLDSPYTLTLPPVVYEIKTYNGKNKVFEEYSSKIIFFGEDAFLTVLRDITDISIK
jgi:PAS domain S-box-containing protein